MKNELVALYEKLSKHSGYQILPSVLQDIVKQPLVQTIKRYEQARMDYLKSKISFTNKKILDIGGNTGFFTFEAIEAGATSVDYIEGNSAHAMFVEKAAKLLNLPIQVDNLYLDFMSELKGAPYDIVLLFNVIHHLGDDFGDSAISMEVAKSEIAKAINYFWDKTDILVLQLGFCWKGDRNKLLFTNGTKSEMIDFVRDATDGKWNVLSIGVAMEQEGETSYHDLDDSNSSRNDSLGEFRNRPIFILKSKRNE